MAHASTSTEAGTNSIVLQVVWGVLLAAALIYGIPELNQWWARDIAFAAGNTRWVVSFALLGAGVGAVGAAFRSRPLVLLIAGVLVVFASLAFLMGVDQRMLIGLTSNPVALVVGSAMVGAGAYGSVFRRPA